MVNETDLPAPIPRCQEWREANPEHGAPAPYCCSAYCERCHTLRASDGVPPIEPNEWMVKP